MVQLFKEFFIFVVWIWSLQKHTALPQRKITLVQQDMFVLNTAFVSRYGDVVIMMKSSSIFCRNCVLLKGRAVAFIKGRVNTWTLLQAIHALVDMHTASFVAYALAGDYS